MMENENKKKCPFVFIFHHRFNMMKLLIILFIMKLFAEIKVFFFSLFTFLGLRKVDYPNDIIFANIRQSLSARSFCRWNLALIFWRWKNWTWSKLIALKIIYESNPLKLFIKECLLGSREKPLLNKQVNKFVYGYQSLCCFFYNFIKKLFISQLKRSIKMLLPPKVAKSG